MGGCGGSLWGSAVAGGWGPTTSQATYHSASSAILPALGGDDSIDTKPETLAFFRGFFQSFHPIIGPYTAPLELRTAAIHTPPISGCADAPRNRSDPLAIPRPDPPYPAPAAP